MSQIVTRKGPVGEDKDKASTLSNQCYYIMSYTRKFISKKLLFAIKSSGISFIALLLFIFMCIIKNVITQFVLRVLGTLFLMEFY